MEQKFPKGIRAFKPRENAPDFVVTELVIDPKELVQYCKENQNLLSEYKGAEQIKLTVLVSKDGTKHNIQVNTFKPKVESIRTKKTIFLDFNPVDEANWVYDVADKEYPDPAP